MPPWAKRHALLDGYQMAELGRAAMETFVRSQKKFLDVLAEETAHATGEHNGTKIASKKRTEFAELAREGAEAFIDAQKKLLDIAAQQLAVEVKGARQAAEAIRPLPAALMSGVARRAVDSFVDAQKAVLDLVGRPSPKSARSPDKPKAPPRKTARHHRHAEPAAATATA